MKTPYITVKCSHCGTLVMVPGEKAQAGESEGGPIVYVGVICPECGTKENHILSD